MEKRFARTSMATSMIGNKPTFHIKKWIEDENADFEAGGEA